MGDESLRESMTHMVHSTNSKSVLGNMDRSQLNKPTGLSSVPMDHAQNTLDGGLVWGPPLSKEIGPCLLVIYSEEWLTERVLDPSCTPLLVFGGGIGWARVSGY
ncbi:hypothetical protein Adt_27078 [Abeliophyllum distichum]|uniref:Uncharacterized protein n=1 Tax=Abeliophyllum distichum TaxID=126358 RepID=A0ABD1RSR1_9LAMI